MTKLNFPSKPVISPDAGRDITVGARLSKMYGRLIGPTDVARVLHAANAKYVLVGAHAANGYTATPRTTVDVDIIAARPKQARDALALAFPNLVVEEHPVVIRFKDADHEAIDIIRPESSKLFAMVLKCTHIIELDGTPVIMPSVEAVLAMKFNSMITISRKTADRMQDATDFMRVVDANPSLDQTKLVELGELVYPEASKELLQHIANAKAGKQLEI